MDENKKGRKAYIDYDQADRTIVSVDHFGKGVFLVNRIKLSYTGQPLPYGNRSNIQVLTRRARMRMLHTIAVTKVEFRSLITLTYPIQYPVSGKVVKAHLHKFLNRLTHRYSCHYFWFLEFQRRGAPHFHILTTRPVYHDDRAWLSVVWPICQGIHIEQWYTELKTRNSVNLFRRVKDVHRHTKAWENIRTRDGAIRYVSKYATKTTQKEVPDAYQDVGRFWGCNRAVRERHRRPETIEVTSEQLRSALKLCGSSVSDWDVIPRYLFSSELSKLIGGI